MSLSFSGINQLPELFQPSTQAFLSLIEGLAGYGTHLGNAGVTDLIRLYDPNNEKVGDFAVDRIAQYVRTTFCSYIEPLEESPEEIAEDFFAAYPHWAVYFAVAIDLYEHCEANLDEGHFRMTSADWRVWVARMDKTYDILKPVNTELRSDLVPFFSLRIAKPVQPTVQPIEYSTDEKAKNRTVLAAGIAIGVVATGLSLPLIAEFAPGLVQIPDYQMPVLEKNHGK